MDEVDGRMQREKVRDERVDLLSHLFVRLEMAVVALGRDMGAGCCCLTAAGGRRHWSRVQVRTCLDEAEEEEDDLGTHRSHKG